MSMRFRERETRETEEPAHSGVPTHKMFEITPDITIDVSESTYLIFVFKINGSYFVVELMGDEAKFYRFDNEDDLIKWLASVIEQTGVDEIMGHGDTFWDIYDKLALTLARRHGVQPVYMYCVRGKCFDTMQEAEKYAASLRRKRKPRIEKVLDAERTLRLALERI